MFDIAQLTQEEIGHIEYVLNSPSYARAFKPYLERWRDSMRHTLEDPAVERKNKFSDDFLRGQIATISGFLKFCDEMIKETNFQRMSEAQTTTPNEEYAKLQALGLVRHSGQTAPPRRDDEDF